MRAKFLMIALGLSVVLAMFISNSARAEQTIESNVNRPGGDYKNFEMAPTIAGFAPCQSACTSDPNCRAWTFVNSGVQGPKAHCWLKNTVPKPVNNNCCTSGVSGVITGIEFGTNRPGKDYRSFDIANADLRDQPELLCRSACQKEDQCRAWTYVKPNIQGPKAKCWLKSAVPGAQASNCCISGLDTKPVKTTGPTPTPGGGTPTPSSSVPSDWNAMLKAHNDFRAQHCSPPLAWDANLAAAAQAYAATCPDGHGASNENLAAAWGNSNGVDKQPALTDPEAFTNTWSCEEKFYDYTDPRICPGFKNACNEPKPDCKNNNPVTGHYTQVVWKSATSVGCGRAKCPFKGSDGVTHQGTKWVCRYSGGNDGSATALRANVLPLGCK